MEVVRVPTPDALASSRTRGDGQQTKVGGQVRNVGAGQALIEAGKDCAAKAAVAKSRRRTERALTHRLARAEVFVHLGELSAGRSRICRDTQCIEEETSSAVRGVSSRIDPPQARSFVCTGQDHFNKNLRSAKERRGRRWDDGGTSPTFV